MTLIKRPQTEESTIDIDVNKHSSCTLKDPTDFTNILDGSQEDNEKFKSLTALTIRFLGIKAVLLPNIKVCSKEHGVILHSVVSTFYTETLHHLGLFTFWLT